MLEEWFLFLLVDCFRLDELLDDSDSDEEDDTSADREREAASRSLRTSLSKIPIFYLSCASSSFEDNDEDNSLGRAGAGVLGRDEALWELLPRPLPRPWPDMILTWVTAIHKGTKLWPSVRKTRRKRMPAATLRTCLHPAALSVILLPTWPKHVPMHMPRCQRTRALVSVFVRPTRSEHYLSGLRIQKRLLCTKKGVKMAVTDRVEQVTVVGRWVWMQKRPCRRKSVIAEMWLLSTYGCLTRLNL